MTTLKTIIDNDRIQSVQTALAEDIRSGDITAQLIAKETFASATILTREPMTLCGQAWVDEVYQQLGTDAASVSIEWCASDGDHLQANQVIAHLAGPARTLLTGERSALNFLQTLSGTATRCREYADIVTGTQVKLLDTRKTIPGLRTAQKYAVTCGGCHNHRVGLYDAFLIKENHIMASGSITTAVTKARALQPNTLIEVEVENQTQLQEALQAHCDIIMLDNFSLSDIRQAVATAQGRTKLEISGNVELSGLRDYAETGVDYISIGGLTKHLSAIDLSMRFHLENP